MSLALDNLNNGSRGRKSLGLTIPPSVLGRADPACSASGRPFSHINRCCTVAVLHFRSAMEYW